MTPAPAMVYIVDDDDAVRSALRLLIKSVGLAVEAYASAPRLPRATSTADRPGCLVLDVRMPGMSGLELQQELNRGARSCRSSSSPATATSRWRSRPCSTAPSISCRSRSATRT